MKVYIQRYKCHDGHEYHGNIGLLNYFFERFFFLGRIIAQQASLINLINKERIWFETTSFEFSEINTGSNVGYIELYTCKLKHIHLLFG